MAFHMVRRVISGVLIMVNARLFIKVIVVRVCHRIVKVEKIVHVVFFEMFVLGLPLLFIIKMMSRRWLSVTESVLLGSHASLNLGLNFAFLSTFLFRSRMR